jgi:hypothetical protein
MIWEIKPKDVRTPEEEEVLRLDIENQIKY